MTTAGFDSRASTTDRATGPTIPASRTSSRDPRRTSPGRTRRSSAFATMSNDSTFPKNYYNNAQLHYQFTNGSSLSASPCTPIKRRSQQQHQGMTALYAQDRWTLHRLTLQAGLRFERLVDHFDQQQMGPNIGSFRPRSCSPPRTAHSNHKDLQPRFGATYDVFGNGKTAVEVLHGRVRHDRRTPSTSGSASVLQGSDTLYVECATAPGSTPTTTSSPTAICWINPLSNDPTSPGYNAARDSCGVGNPFFGTVHLSANGRSGGHDRLEYAGAQLGFVGRHFSAARPEGVGRRDATTGGAGATSRRRVNRALKPTDFNPFTYNVPKDPKLPGGGGYTLTFEEIAPAKFNQFDNLLHARRQRRVARDQPLQRRRRIASMRGCNRGSPCRRGFSTGNVIEDDVRPGRAAPGRVNISSILDGGSLGFGSTFIGGLAQLPQSSCHRESGWQTNYKGLASLQHPQDRRGVQRDVPQPAISGKQLSVRHQPEPDRARRFCCPARRVLDSGGASLVPLPFSSSTSSSPVRYTAIGSTASISGSPRS